MGFLMRASSRSAGYCASAFFAPTPRQSLFGGFVVNAIDLTPFRYRLFFSVNDGKKGVAPVSSLLFAACPSTVFLAIILASIYSVYGVPGGPFPHVLYEYSKIVPLFTYFYTFCSVIFILLAILIVAPLSHIKPCAVEWVRCAISSFGAVVSYFRLGSETSAAHGNLPNDKGGRNFRFVSAVADAVPLYGRLASANHFNNSYHPVPLACEVCRLFWHFLMSLCVMGLRYVTKVF